MTENALAFMRRLREGLDAGLDLPEAIARAVTALPRDARATVGRLLERMDGNYTEDEWGFDEEFADLVEPLFGFLYDTWWRVRVEGAERVPAHGARDAGGEPRRHPALGRDDDLDGAAARAPAPAPPALPRPRLGLRAALDLDRDPARRRGRRLALQRAAAARAGHARGGVPRGREGDRQALFGALPAAALRSRRVRRGGAAGGRSDRAGGGRRKRGDLSQARRRPGARAADRRALLPRHAHLPVARPARRGTAAVALADRVPRARSRPPRYGPEATSDRALVLELSERVRAAIQEALYANLVKRGPAFV